MCIIMWENGWRRLHNAHLQHAEASVQRMLSEIVSFRDRGCYVCIYIYVYMYEWVCMCACTCVGVCLCARVCFMTELLRYYSQLRFLVVL